MTEQNRQRTYVIVALILFSMFAAYALAQKGGRDASVTPAMQFLEDVNGELALDDVLAAQSRFSPLSQSSANFGFSNSAYWLAARLDRPASGDTLYFNLSYPLLDHIDLYLLFDDGIFQQYKAGDAYPFSQRPVKHRSFVFPIEYKEDRQSAELYARVLTTSSMQLSVSLWQPEAFHADSHDEQLILGLYYGLLVAILVYNAMLALSVREPVYAYYALYVLFYGLFQMCLNGLAFEYLWPSSSYLAQKGTLVFMALSAPMAAVFSREILELSSRQTVLQKLFWVYIISNAAGLPLALLLPYSISIQIQTLVVTIGTVLFAYSGIVQSRNGVAAARYYLFAWALFLAGIFVYSLKTYAILPENAFTEYAMQFGSAMEVMLLSFAIAHRFKILREEKFRLQRESSELLEHRVAQRTVELESTLGKLSAANDRLEILSNTDFLTGVHNRAFFDTRFELMWKDALRRRTSIAALMIDIDHFKTVNDEHGHLVGDRVIASVSKLVGSSILRSNDLLARYGGEEFVVILPDTVLQDAAMVAERIRSAVWTHAGTEVDSPDLKKVSISIGVAAEIPDLAHSADRSEHLLAAADAALYQAKRNGRNRVWTSQHQQGDIDSRKPG